MATHTNDAIDPWVGERLDVLSTDADWQPNVARGRALLAARQQERRHRPRLLVASAGGAALALSLFALPATRLFAARCVEACVSQAGRVTGFFRNDEPPATPPSIDPGLVGTMAPDFTLLDASGRAVSLSSFRGQVVLLNFWATWCPPCVQETAWFVEFQREFSAAGFTVVGVSLDEDGWVSVRPFLAEHQVNYPVVIGSEDLTNQYGHLGSLPATLTIDRTGRIAAIQSGVINKDVYQKAIESALTERNGNGGDR